ncbi:hypothetical protein QEN19_000040 [Hanseniaspora menglaensis]
MNGKVKQSAVDLEEDFKLPITEFLIVTCKNVEMRVEFNNENNEHINSIGTLHLTPHYLIYRDYKDYQYLNYTIHLGNVRKMEKVNNSEQLMIVLTLSGEIKKKLLIRFNKFTQNGSNFIINLKRCLVNDIDIAKNIMPKFNDKLMTSSYIKNFNELLNKNNLLDIDSSKPDSKNELNFGLGLGSIYGFPGDKVITKQEVKEKLWRELFVKNGSGLQIIKNADFYKLVRVGICDIFRGEVWENLSGAMYQKFQQPGIYKEILESNMSKHSQAVEDIEKDVKRSLPEYSGFLENAAGIDSLRNVLVAYSWKNPEVGYCQAMNIVAAELLIYMGEEETFWCISQLCENYLKGYYSKNMEGIILDQQILEILIREKIPVLYSHIQRYDIQITVMTLSWFLSLFTTVLPLEYSARIMDIFWVNGGRLTLFQISLAILKICGENLLLSTDDAHFVTIFREFFNNVTHQKFQRIMVTAFKEFGVIDYKLINQLTAEIEQSDIHGKWQR